MKVLFLCTGNSCRSQMAEGLINNDFKGKIEAKSAGIMPEIVNPYAIRAMDEIDIDISHQRSKHVEQFKDESFDLVITLCDYANDTCPIWPKEGEVVHIPFDDPVNAVGPDNVVIGEYIRVRDLIRKKVGDFLKKRLDEMK